MKNKLLKKIIIGTGSVLVGAGIVLSAPGLINSSQNKTHTKKDSISDRSNDFNQVVFSGNPAAIFNLDNFEINSTFDWSRTKLDIPNDGGIQYTFANSSKSQIDLTALQVELGANFTLSRRTDTVDELISKLSKLNIGVGQRAFSPPYDASTAYNEGMIQSLIESEDPKMSKITYGLSFEGKLEVGKTNPLEVYYLGMDQNITMTIRISE